MIPALTKFMDKVVKQPDGCWEWQSYKRSGYGRLRLNGKAVSAHRISYDSFVGPIPDGLLVCHTCDNRKCVNPEHLFLGTHADNGADMAQKGRAADKSGLNNGRAKLTEADVLAIRADTRSGPKIAKEYGLSRQSVQNIRHKITWSHI